MGEQKGFADARLFGKESACYRLPGIGAGVAVFAGGVAAAKDMPGCGSSAISLSQGWGPSGTSLFKSSASIAESFQRGPSSAAEIPAWATDWQAYPDSKIDFSTSTHSMVTDLR